MKSTFHHASRCTKRIRRSESIRTKEKGTKGQVEKYFKQIEESKMKKEEKKKKKKKKKKTFQLAGEEDNRTRDHERRKQMIVSNDGQKEE